MTESPSPFAAGAAYIDGRYMPIGDAAIPITDWGYRRSDVTYDVVGVRHGSFFRLDDHVRRFRASMNAFRFNPKESDEDIKAILHRCVALCRAEGRLCRHGLPARPPAAWHALSSGLCAQLHRRLRACPGSGSDARSEERGSHLVVAETLRIPGASVDPTAKNFHWADLTRGQFEAHRSRSRLRAPAR